MGSLSPFLQKLQLIVQSTPKEVAGWDEEGKEYKVYDTERFEKEILAKHFKGSLLTFIRQLHFYCFKKMNHPNNVWGFVHPKFLKDSPHLVFEIKRKTRTENRGGAPASKLELDMVRSEMSNMKNTLRKELDEVKSELNGLFANIQKEVMLLSEMGSKNMMYCNQMGFNRMMAHSMPQNSYPMHSEKRDDRWSQASSGKEEKAKGNQTDTNKRKSRGKEEESEFYNNQDTQSALHALKKLRNDDYYEYEQRQRQNMGYPPARMVVNSPGVMYYRRN